MWLRIYLLQSYRELTGFCLSFKDYNTDTSPSIKSPIVFLVVNFIYIYTIFVIVICLYGLYKCPKSKSSHEFSNKLYEIGTVVDNNDISSCDTESSQSCTDGEETIIRVNSFSVRISPTLTSNVIINYRNTWPGDWNKYWNSKSDY